MAETTGFVPYTDDDILTPYARSIEFWVRAMDYSDKFPSAEDAVQGCEGIQMDRFVGTLATAHTLKLTDSRFLLLAAYDEVTAIRKRPQKL